MAIGFCDRLIIIRPGLLRFSPGMALAILIASAIYISVHERVRRVAEVREVAQGLAEAGAMDKRRLRGFDALCLTPVEPFSPEEIRALRLRENSSQRAGNLGQKQTADSSEQLARKPFNA